jgi:hypothetical protein
MANSSSFGSIIFYKKHKGYSDQFELKVKYKVNTDSVLVGILEGLGHHQMIAVVQNWRVVSQRFQTEDFLLASEL